MMVVVMLGVTLFEALAMRHLAVMFSLGGSKRDTRGVVAIVGERSNFKKIPTHTQDHGDA